jgi:hypothetical protein
MNRRLFIKSALAILAALVLPKAKVEPRHMGGPVKPGTPYVMGGEQGPEIFTPYTPYTPPGMIAYNDCGDIWWKTGSDATPWKALDLPPISSIEWPTPTSLYAYLADGRVMISRDYGETWEEI